MREIQNKDIATQRLARIATRILKQKRTCNFEQQIRNLPRNQVIKYIQRD